MWRKEAQTQLLKAINFEGARFIRTTHIVSEFEQKGGNAAHPAAGDTNQMDRVPLFGQKFTTLSTTIRRTWPGNIVP